MWWVSKWHLICDTSMCSRTLEQMQIKDTCAESFSFFKLECYIGLFAVCSKWTPDHLIFEYSPRGHLFSPQLLSIFSSPGTNVLGEVLSYPRRRCRRRRCCRRCRWRRQFQVKVFSSPGTNVLGEVLSYPRRRCRHCRWRRQFQVKVFVF